MALTKISTPGIKDEAITLAKLLHGDSNNNGKFLKANNGADPTFETIDLTALSASNLTSGTIPNARFPATLPAVSAANLTNIPAANITGALPAIDGSNLTGVTSTTINNNADNRVITGSGTANTLEGESNLTFNGTKLSLTPPANTGNDGLEIIPAGGSTASSFKVRGNQSAGVAAGRNGGVVEIDANYYVATSDIFTIKSRGSTVLNMYGNGNVGLGVTNPTTLLHLKVNQQTAKMITLNGDDTRNNYIGINGGDNLEIAADEDAAGSSSSIRFRVDGTERMRMDSDGLKFNGDTAAANALDDCERGNWTPILDRASGTIGGTLHTAIGMYIKIGKMVYITFHVYRTGATGGSSYYQLAGLPFGVDSSNQGSWSISPHMTESYWDSHKAAGDNAIGFKFLGSNNTYGYSYNADTDGWYTSNTNSIVIKGQMTYITAS